MGLSHLTVCLYVWYISRIDTPMKQIRSDEENAQVIEFPYALTVGCKRSEFTRHQGIF